jgi:hypothetical protein
LFFSDDDRDILKEEDKTYLMAQSLPLSLTIGFFYQRMYFMAMKP